jgi:hypothetical protein
MNIHKIAWARYDKMAKLLKYGYKGRLKQLNYINN